MALDELKSTIMVALYGKMWEARWPNGYCAGLQIQRSGFEPWPGTALCS